MPRSSTVVILRRFASLLVAAAVVLVASPVGAQVLLRTGSLTELPATTHQSRPVGWEPVAAGASAEYSCHTMLPQGLIYASYLAGEKESRFRSYWSHEKDSGWLWDLTAGGRVGLWRYGTTLDERPQGWQLDIEGAAMPRLDLERDRDLVSADFRFGLPLTYGNDYYQGKFGYYHLSSHLGDEFLLANPGFTRLNYSRDELVWGHSLTPCEYLRLYVEAGWAFYSDISEPWAFQFGVDWAPTDATGARGAPFAAINAHLRQEVDYGGNLVVQVGWAWRRSPVSGMFRCGFEYYGGKSDQFAFFNESEQRVGLAIWYDY